MNAPVHCGHRVHPAIGALISIVKYMWARARVCMVVCEQGGSRLVRGRHRMCMCLIALCHTSQIAKITLTLYDRKRATQKCPCQEQRGEARRWWDTGAEGAHASWSCTLLILTQQDIKVLKSVSFWRGAHEPPQTSKSRWTSMTAAPRSFWRSH